MDIVNTSELAKQIYPFVIASVASGLTYDAIIAVIEKALEFVDIKNRIKPPYNVAIPSIQGIAFNSDNKILQNMFYALLTKSMDKTQQNNAHPAFPQILGQISIQEIRVLYMIFSYKGIYKYSLSDNLQTITVTDFPWENKNSLFNHMLHLSYLGLISDPQERGAFKITSYGLHLTNFGQQFIEACLSPEAEKLIQELINNPQ